MAGLLEIACFNVESALIAAKAGAHRIEFCADYTSGGVTPAIEDFSKVKKAVSIPVFIMVRPRPGSFYYNREEFENLKSQISNFKSLGADGFVLGVLDSSGCIDVARNSELIKLANPLPCTLHRMFDETPDTLKSLEDAITCGFARILTAGGPGNAIDNLETLKNLVSVSGTRIGILPGGGIRNNNVKSILQTTACNEIHSAAAIHSAPTLANAEEIQNLVRHMV
ncbi:MAG: copper homeostasis protein CutC [Flavobacteriales bacterium]